MTSFKSSTLRNFNTIFPFLSLLPIMYLYKGLERGAPGLSAIIRPLILSLTILAIVNILYLYLHKKNYISEPKAFHLFSLLLGFSLLKAIFGLDTTDTGFALSKAWNFYIGDPTAEMDFIWASSWLSSLWLRIPGDPSLIWARLLYNIIMAFNGMAVYLIVRKIVSVKFIIWVGIILAGWAISTLQLLIPNYNNIPVFLISLSALLFWTGVLNKTTQGIKKILILTAGLIMGLSVHTRLPYVFYYTLPFFLYGYYRFSRNRNDYLKKDPFHSELLFIGMITGFLIGLIILSGLGGLDVYIERNLSFLQSNAQSTLIVNNQPLQHGISRLILINIKNIIKTVIPFFSLLIMHYLLFLNNRKIHNYKLRLILRFIISGITIGTLFISSIYPMELGLPKHSILGLILFNYYLYFISCWKDKNFFFISAFILFTVFLGLVSSLGSDRGFYTMFNSGAIIWPFTFSFGLLLVIPTTEFNQIYFVKRFQFVILLLFVILSTISWRPYRDDSFSRGLVPFTSPSIRGVLSNEDRVHAVDEVYTYCMQLPDWKNSRLLVLNSAPLFYFILDKPYYTTNDWGPWVYLNPFQHFQNILQTQNENPPDIVILAISAQRSNWPFINKPVVRDENIPKYQYTLKWLEDGGYISTFQNKAYSVYMKQDTLFNGF